MRAPHSLRDALDLRDVGDRHDARDDRHPYPDAPRAGDEIEVVRVVEEQLGDDEVQPGVDLLAQVLEIQLAVGALLVTLGVAGAAEAEVVALLADEANQLGGVSEAVLRGRESALALRRIATQGEDVFDAAVAQAVEQRAISARSWPTQVRCAMASIPNSRLTRVTISIVLLRVLPPAP